ncbi:hypothetical protein D3C80_2174750 [compost metagenome]
MAVYLQRCTYTVPFFKGRIGVLRAAYDADAIHLHRQRHRIQARMLPAQADPCTKLRPDQLLAKLR